MAERICEVCRLPNPPEQLVCLRCNAQLVDSTKTYPVRPEDFADLLPGLLDDSHNHAADHGSTGDVTNPSVVLELTQGDIRLPLVERLVVGRLGHQKMPEHPFIDLTDFRAEEFGVSRQHVEIVQRDNGVFVIDLNSSNGSYLNGRRLVPNAERVLRSGDQLQLGRLTMKIKF